MLKLDLGAGEISPPGFVRLGRDFGTDIYPVPYADGTVDEIRASHVLEHFSHRHIGAVIKDWVRALKKGGRLRIAVPDFAKIAQNFLEGKSQPTEFFVMGGQTDPNDFHKSMFSYGTLRKMMAEAGLVLVTPWKSEIEDCAAYDISLNLEGYKPHLPEIKVSGCMSVGRFAPTYCMYVIAEACIACGVKLKQLGGAFWGQSLSNVMDVTLEEDNPDAIVTFDYDSLITPKDLAQLMQLMMLYPDIDALAAIQASRHLKTTLFTVHGKSGQNSPVLSRASFDGHTQQVATAHFGCTILRADKLRALPKPWMQSVPSKGGEWKDGDGHVDEDINFWREWEAAGNSLHLANHVAIGHGEFVGIWPDINLEGMYQRIDEFRKNGKPEGVWQ